VQAETASEAAANRKMARRIDLLGFASAWLVAMVALQWQWMVLL
jgi:hypothetical protein